MVNILLHSKTKKAPHCCRAYFIYQNSNFTYYFTAFFIQQFFFWAFYLKLNELEIYQTDIDINHSLAFYNVHA